MSSVQREVQRRQLQRLERRAKPALPRIIGRHVEQVLPEGSQRARGASWHKSARMGWHRATTWGRNFGTIR